MLGLRVRGRGGRDRTAAVAAPISAFLWGSTPFLCARAKKWGGTGNRGERLLPKKTAHTHRAQMRCRLVFALYVCADTLGGGFWLVLPFDPFLWCLPKETVSSRQRKALFLPRYLHHSRERYCLGCLYSSSPDLGQGLGGYLSACLRRGRTGFVMAALRGWSIARVSLSLSGSAHLQKRVSLGLHPVSLRKSKEMGWNGQQGGETTTQ